MQEAKFTILYTLKLCLFVYLIYFIDLTEERGGRRLEQILLDGRSRGQEIILFSSQRTLSSLTHFFFYTIPPSQFLFPSPTPSQPLSYIQHISFCLLCSYKINGLGWFSCILLCTNKVVLCISICFFFLRILFSNMLPSECLHPPKINTL